MALSSSAWQVLHCPPTISWRIFSPPILCLSLHPLCTGESKSSSLFLKHGRNPCSIELLWYIPVITLPYGYLILNCIFPFYCSCRSCWLWGKGRFVCPAYDLVTHTSPESRCVASLACHISYVPFLPRGTEGGSRSQGCPAVSADRVGCHTAGTQGWPLELALGL